MIHSVIVILLGLVFLPLKTNAQACTIPSQGYQCNGMAIAPCPMGQYNEGGPGTSCKPCPSGHIASMMASSSCTLCTTGSYASNDATMCNGCPQGYYCVSGRKHECGAGYFCFFGSGAPMPCPVGTYGDPSTPTLFSSTCSGMCTALPGSICGLAATSASGTVCTQGYQPDRMAAVCSPIPVCPPGFSVTRAMIDNFKSCAACSPGSTTLVSDATECVQCSTLPLGTCPTVLSSTIRIQSAEFKLANGTLNSFELGIIQVKLSGAYGIRGEKSRGGSLLAGCDGLPAASRELEGTSVLVCGTTTFTTFPRKKTKDGAGCLHRSLPIDYLLPMPQVPDVMQAYIDAYNGVETHQSRDASLYNSALLLKASNSMGMSLINYGVYAGVMGQCRLELTANITGGAAYSIPLTLVERTLSNVNLEQLLHELETLKMVLNTPLRHPSHMSELTPSDTTLLNPVLGASNTWNAYIMDSVMTNAVVRNFRQVREVSNKCVYNYFQAPQEWSEDSCCNTAQLLTECCLEKESFSWQVVSIGARDRTAHIDSVAALDDWATALNTGGECGEGGPVFNAFYIYYNCQEDIRLSRVNCTVDGECWSGVCITATGKCYIPWNSHEGVSGALAACLFSRLEELWNTEEKGKFYNALGLPVSSTLPELNAALLALATNAPPENMDCNGPSGHEHSGGWKEVAAQDCSLEFREDCPKTKEFIPGNPLTCLSSHYCNWGRGLSQEFCVPGEGDETDPNTCLRCIGVDDESHLNCVGLSEPGLCYTDLVVGTVQCNQLLLETTATGGCFYPTKRSIGECLFQCPWPHPQMEELPQAYEFLDKCGRELCYRPDVTNSGGCGPTVSALEWHWDAGAGLCFAFGIDLRDQGSSLVQQCGLTIGAKYWAGGSWAPGTLSDEWACTTEGVCSYEGLIRDVYSDQLRRPSNEECTQLGQCSSVCTECNPTASDDAPMVSGPPGERGICFFPSLSQLQQTEICPAPSLKDEATGICYRAVASRSECLGLSGWPSWYRCEFGVIGMTMDAHQRCVELGKMTENIPDVSMEARLARGAQCKLEQFVCPSREMCEATGRCTDYEFEGGMCTSRGGCSSNQIAQGWRQGLYECMNPSISQTQCGSISGATWRKRATNREACEQQDFLCEMPGKVGILLPEGARNGEAEAACVECSVTGVSHPRFTWVPGVWRPGTMTLGSWDPKQWRATNRWVSVFPFTTIAARIAGIQDYYAAVERQAAMRCKHSLKVDAMKRYACSTLRSGEIFYRDVNREGILGSQCSFILNSTIPITSTTLPRGVPSAVFAPGIGVLTLSSPVTYPSSLATPMVELSIGVGHFAGVLERPIFNLFLPEDPPYKILVRMRVLTHMIVIEGVKPAERVRVCLNLLKSTGMEELMRDQVAFPNIGIASWGDGPVDMVTFGLGAPSSSGIICDEVDVFGALVGVEYSETLVCIEGYFMSGGMDRDCVLCAPGTYTNAPGAEKCTACAIGFYNPNSGGRECTKCPTGTYGNTTGERGCKNCPAGTYNGELGASECVQCPAGQTPTPRADACTWCPAGMYSVTGVCHPCAPGTISKPQSYVCTPCPSGSVPAPNATVCVTCAPGSSALSGAAACTPCPPGYANSRSGAGECVACPAGEFAGGTGNTACSSCEAGKFSGSPGSAVCGTCSAGEYSGARASVCLTCPAGYYSGVSGAGSCGVCAPGSYSTRGSPACVPCLIGSISTRTAATSCSACPPGEVSGRSWSTFCTPCSAGSIAPAEGMGECTPCGAGSFISSSGGTLCTPCSPGFHAPNNGSAVCTPCPINTFSDRPGAQSCTKCPVKHEAPVGSVMCTEVQCPVGLAWNPQLQECNVCPPGSTSSVSVCTPCSPGRAGNCSVCPPGTVAPEEGTPACQPCPAGSYIGTPGGLSCRPCPPGYTSLNGSSGCTACPPGRVASKQGSPVCTPCPTGQYSPSSGTTGCLGCPAGSVAPDAGSASCTPCPPGTYSGVVNGTVCSNCIRGFFSETPGSTQCTACPPGSITATGGLGECTPCSPGYYSAAPGNHLCTICPIGTIASNSGASKCKSCPLNTISNLPGGRKCELCPDGYYAFTNFQCLKLAVSPIDESGDSSSSRNGASGSGSVQQEACPPGNYLMVQFCVACPSGTYSNSWNTTNCITCSIGTVSDIGATQCTPGEFINTKSLSTTWILVASITGGLVVSMVGWYFCRRRLKKSVSNKFRGLFHSTHASSTLHISQIVTDALDGPDFSRHSRRTSD